jgi:hypothetical protein
MVYNAKYNFLFIHIQKTAGTSINRALRRLEGTQFIAPAHLRWKDIRLTTATRPFIFTVVRNPWDRLVSWYEMMLRKGGHNDFSRYLLGIDDERASLSSFPEYIRKVEVINETYLSELADSTLRNEMEFMSTGPHFFKSIGFNQLDYISDETNQICCDQVLRFENLEADWIELCSQLGFPSDLRLPKANANPNPVPWRRYYADVDDREWVAKLYERDIAYFGYRFDV